MEKILDREGVKTDLDLEAIVEALKERITFTDDLWKMGEFLFAAPTSYDEKASKKAFKEDTGGLMMNVIHLLSGLEDFNAQTASEAVKGWITAQEMGFGKVMMPLRLSLVGAMQGPDVFEIIELLGKKESIKRIEAAVAYMDQK